MINNEEKNVDLFDMDEDSGLDFLNKKTGNKDGIYRPNSKDAKDIAKGYIATIRFLPNLLKDGTTGPSAIEKFQHYAKLTDNTDLAGYYDCAKNKNPDCPICKTYWKLKNSKNQAEVERSELIKRTAKYYSYVQIIEDVQHSELVGKIMVFPYGVKIRDKINIEKNGEVSGDKCNVFRLEDGKDFRLIVKSAGQYQNNYDTSSFRDKSPIKLFDPNTGKFKEVPIEFDEAKGKNVIKGEKVKTMLKEYLLSRTVELSDFDSKDWTDVEKGKIDAIIDIVLGNDVNAASSFTKNTNSTNTKKPISSKLDDEDEDVDNFFADAEDNE
jgi:hypothetical protein